MCVLLLIEIKEPANQVVKSCLIETEHQSEIQPCTPPQQHSIGRIIIVNFGKYHTPNPINKCSITVLICDFACIINDFFA